MTVQEARAFSVPDWDDAQSLRLRSRWCLLLRLLKKIDHWEAQCHTYRHWFQGHLRELFPNVAFLLSAILAVANPESFLSYFRVQTELSRFLFRFFASIITNFINKYNTRERIYRNKAVRNTKNDQFSIVSAACEERAARMCRNVPDGRVADLDAERRTEMLRKHVPNVNMSMQIRRIENAWASGRPTRWCEVVLLWLKPNVRKA